MSKEDKQNEDVQLRHIKGVIEALLFVNERPVTLDQIKKVLNTVTAAEIKAAFKSLNKDHKENNSGTHFVEIAGGYQMLSNPEFASYIRDFYKTKHKEKLSKPALETLAIIAYKQPVTRSDIEIIRGVNSDGVVTHLVEKELIKIVGKKDVAGRPFIYGTTKQFLEYFGLKSLENLPKLEEFEKLKPVMESDSEHEIDKTGEVKVSSLEAAKQSAISNYESEESQLKEAIEDPSEAGESGETSELSQEQVATAVVQAEEEETEEKEKQNES